MPKGNLQQHSCVTGVAHFPLCLCLQAEEMSKTLAQDTRVAVNLTGRYLLVTGYKNSILGTVSISYWNRCSPEMLHAYSA